MHATRGVLVAMSAILAAALVAAIPARAVPAGCAATLPIPSGEGTFVLTVTDFDAARRAKVLTASSELVVLPKAVGEKDFAALSRLQQSIGQLPQTMVRPLLTGQGPSLYPSRAAGCAVSSMFGPETEVVRLTDDAKLTSGSGFRVAMKGRVGIISPIGQERAASVQQPQQQPAYLRTLLQGLDEDNAMSGLIVKSLTVENRGHSLAAVAKNGKLEYVISWSASDVATDTLVARARKAAKSSAMIKTFGTPVIARSGKRVRITFTPKEAAMTMFVFVGSQDKDALWDGVFQS